MKIVKQSAELLQITPNAAQLIERAGRTCYKSEDRITPDSSSKFIRMIMKRGHESVIEHASATIKFVTDRGVSHELVRHRLVSYSQESTRYCNYGGPGITVICPFEVQDSWINVDIDCKEYAVEFYANHPPIIGVWLDACLDAERKYKFMLEKGESPQIARSVLPTCLKTEIVTTANFREWRHIFKLRRGITAHPQIHEVMDQAFEKLYNEVPEIFEDLK